ncbi:MAG TPA: Fur family transcriptional regulator [Patescibacteria group bacterium]|nr:Fur family transcriptional regulator [Patescibacteria group bacterium]
MSKLLLKCAEAGLKMTDQRKVILKVLEESGDHPSVDTVCDRAKRVDPSISIATVYRTLGLLAELGLVVKHDFGGTYARFEVKEEHDHEHHHHLIDTETGQVIEFQSDELEAHIHKIAEGLGYKIIDHTFEIFGHKIKK